MKNKSKRLNVNLEIMHDAWKNLSGVEFPKDGAAGKAGVIWSPSSVDPRNETRSYARTAHYDPAKNRSNYALLTGHKVVKIGFSSGWTPLTAESVLITPRFGNESAKTVTANNEIILAAGTIHTPQILQRSGVGPRALLAKANITVVHDLPGVGQNFHDHSYLTARFNREYLGTDCVVLSDKIVTTNVFPNPEMLSSNATFTKWAQDAWTTNKTG
jgi:choline dehydrogenase-like flavoprotein